MKTTDFKIQDVGTVLYKAVEKKQQIDYLASVSDLDTELIAIKKDYENSLEYYKKYMLENEAIFNEISYRYKNCSIVIFIAKYL